MEEIMQSNTFFIIPLTIAYSLVCASWFVINRRFKLWRIHNIETPSHPKREMGIGLLAICLILLIGRLYAAGFLFSSSDGSFLNYLVWPLNNLLIYSPIFIALLIRKQRLNTVFISTRDIPAKVGFGLVASLLSIVVFIGLRGEWNRFDEIILYATKPETLSSFPAIFFENVAVAFLFVRLKWVMGIKWAIAIPAILFALAHVPGSLAEGDPVGHIVTFFFLTGGLTSFILYTAYRSRDIIWLGFVHYFMDIAIKAV